MRQTNNVLVLPYKKIAHKIYYAVFKRSDANIYQGLLRWSKGERIIFRSG